MSLTKLTTELNTISMLETVIRDQATTVKAAFDYDVNVVKDYINDVLTKEIDAQDAVNVKKTGDQTVDGVKTFSSSPIIPTPTAGMHASTKKYADDILTVHKSSTDHDGRYFTETELGSIVDDESGAGKIGVTPILTLAGENAQSVLESIKDRLDDIGETNTNVELSNSHYGANSQTYSSVGARCDAIDTELVSVNSELAEITSLQKKQIERRGIQDSIVSISKSRAGYEDTANTVFTEDWSDLSAWVTSDGVQVANGKLYSTGTGGGNHGANHAISLNSDENLRVVAKVSVPSFGSDNGGIIIGVSKDVSGAMPPTGSVNAFGVYIRNMDTYMQEFNLGITTYGPENTKTQVGDFIVTVLVDEMYISVSVVKTDDTQELCYRRLRAGFEINNLHIFNDDARGTDGMYITEFSARKSLQTIYPRSFGEGVTKNIQWTGNETQGYRIYLPKNYDSRMPSPVAICFHGATTNEYAWSINTNYKQIQQALVDDGYIVLTFGDVNTTTFGASVSTLGYAKAYKYLKDHYAISSVVMFADSMGGIESLNALSENKIPCVAWVGTAPTYNLRNCYDNPIFTGAIRNAYGIAQDGSDYNVKTLGRDPALMTPLTFRCIPMLIISANDDTTVDPSQNAIKLLNDLNGYSLDISRTVVPDGMYGHSFIYAPYLTQIIDFFNKYISA